MRYAVAALALFAGAVVLGGCASASRVVAAGEVVSVHYTGTLDDGTQFDSSQGRAALAFRVGAREVIAGFDRAVVGMRVGQAKKIHIPAVEAYGERRDDLVITVPAPQAPPGLQVGQRVSQGNLSGVVTAVTAASVTIDANHPLAGKALNFQIELVSIK